MVPSYSGTPCLVVPLAGFLQSFVPVARPMKFCTPIGALSENSVQVIFPAVVSMIAVGLAGAGWVAAVAAAPGFAAVLGLAAGVVLVPVLVCAIAATAIIKNTIRIPSAFRIAFSNLYEKYYGKVALYDRADCQNRLLCGGLHLMADALDFAEYAQQVFAENLFDIGRAITAVE